MTDKSPTTKRQLIGMMIGAVVFGISLGMMITIFVPGWSEPKHHHCPSGITPTFGCCYGPSGNMECN